jgi:hypothetical protein
LILGILVIVHSRNNCSRKIRKNSCKELSQYRAHFEQVYLGLSSEDSLSNSTTIYWTLTVYKTRKKNAKIIWWNSKGKDIISWQWDQDHFEMKYTYTHIHIYAFTSILKKEIHVYGRKMRKYMKIHHLEIFVIHIYIYINL